jgi:hypothetical protein
VLSLFGVHGTCTVSVGLCSHQPCCSHTPVEPRQYDLFRWTRVCNRRNSSIALLRPLLLLSCHKVCDVPCSSRTQQQGSYCASIVLFLFNSGYQHTFQHPGLRGVYSCRQLWLLFRRSPFFTQKSHTFGAPKSLRRILRNPFPRIFRYIFRFEVVVGTHKFTLYILYGTTARFQHVHHDLSTKPPAHHGMTIQIS